MENGNYCTFRAIFNRSKTQLIDLAKMGIAYKLSHSSYRI
ncbi:hypothetical protein XBKB1_2970007 [Xenorhabdus bovienii str. kraussei Becker Underwood]|uniref:Transposase n=1 Tax=Xenorhabdus bovienii str. kraussei Becker Underwood TaxID=1398204 RepID=A0A077PU60_XENBV|nr:hypothetical protein XBKB1_2970007 [Xenorhabdus bovienii str. kraussei Becker Underwood]